MGASTIFMEKDWRSLCKGNRTSKIVRRSKKLTRFAGYKDQQVLKFMYYQT